VRTFISWRIVGEKLNAILIFDRRDIVVGEPHWNFYSDRRRVVGEHEALKFGVAFIVATNRGHYQGCHVGGGVLFFFFF
jgi:hypothetical protein